MLRIYTIFILVLLSACSTNSQVQNIKSTEQENLLSPPVLISPSNGSDFVLDVPLTLQWNSNTTLKANQYYNLRLWQAGEEPKDRIWTKDSKVDLSSVINNYNPDYYYWQVTIIETDEQGNYTNAASYWSEVHTFIVIAPTPFPTLTSTSVPIVETMAVTPTLAKFEDANISGLAELDFFQDIHINQEKDVLPLRSELIRRIWQTNTLPDTLPIEVIEDVGNPESGDDDRYNDLENLSHVDSLIIDSGNGFIAEVYHFIPLESINRAIIYHQGHTGDFFKGKNTIAFFLSLGFDVYGISMPGETPHYPIPKYILDTHYGDINTLYFRKKHIIFGELFSAFGHYGYNFFIEPTITTINYIESMGITDINMIGLSGGGWTTVMAAAVDTRIRRSYPVAGTYPMYLRYSDRNGFIGDFEQWLIGIMPEISYLDMYILGSIGKNRKQLAVYNKYDSCCFYGLGYELWYGRLQSFIEELGGEYEIFLDTSHYTHAISSVALDIIWADLQS